MNKFLENLKTQAEDNPFLALMVGAMALTAASKFVTSADATRRTRTWDREVARRERHTRSLR